MLDKHYPNKKDTEKAKAKTPSRYGEIVRISIIGIVANVLLAAFKAIVGFAAGSIAIVLDALNSLTDAFSSIATIIGEKIASLRPSHKYPYGYGRVEYLTSILIAVIIAAAGIISLDESIRRLLHPSPPDYTTVTLIVLVVATIVKIILGFIFIRHGRAINSQPLYASGVDALYDSVLTFGTLVAAAICMIWKIDIDGWVGAVISLFVIKAGIDILRDALSSIIGMRPDEKVVQKIRNIIVEHEGVKGVYDLMIDSFGPEFMWVAAHIEVPDSMRASEIHEITRHISEDLYNECNARAILGIYATNSTGAYKDMHQKLEELVKHHPEILGVHGFYVDEDVKHIDFDMVVDFNHDPEAIKKHIVSEMSKYYPGYTFNVITDFNYAG